MARLGMVIDTRQCIGCQDCVVACNIENNVPPGQRRDWVRTEVKGRFPDLSMRFYSERCNHCDEPPYSGSDRKSTRLNSSHVTTSRMPSSA